MYGHIFLFLLMEITLPRRVKELQVNKNVLISIRDKRIVLLICEMDQDCLSSFKSVLIFTSRPLKFLIIRGSLEEKCTFVWEQIIENHHWLYGSNLLQRSVKKRWALKMERLVVTGYILKFISFYIFWWSDELSYTYTASVSILLFFFFAQLIEINVITCYSKFSSLMSELLTIDNFPLFSTTQYNL